MENTLTVNEISKQNRAWLNTTLVQRTQIIKAVGTRTKTGKVKTCLQLQRECFNYFIANIYNK